MNFLYTLVETFFIDYFIMFIFSLFDFRKKRLVTFLIITIGNGLLLIYFLYQMIMYVTHYNVDLLVLLFYLLDIISVLAAYTLIMIILLRGVRLFKSRRLKRFQNEYDGKNNNKRNIILSTILLFFGLTFLAFGIIVFILIKKFDVKYVFSLILLFTFAITLSTIGVILLIKIKPVKIRNNKELLMFVVMKDKRIFLSDDKVKDDILYPLESKYFLTDFGYLYFKERGKNICYHIKGVEALEDSDYLNINLMEDDKFKFILSELERYNKKEIYLDENFIIKRMKIID